MGTGGRALGAPKKSTGAGSDGHLFEIGHRGEGPCRHLADQALDLGRVRVAAFDVEVDDCLTAPSIGMRRPLGGRVSDDVRHGQAEFTADSVGKVLLHPSGKPQREC